MKNYTKIYLVDDFDMANLLHHALLRKLEIGDEIKVFTNPENAIVDLRLAIKDPGRILILLDINMPEMSGFEFLDIMVQENFPDNIDVLMATSSISKTDKDKAEEYPRFVRDFITKPIKTDRLVTILKPLYRAS